MITRTLGRTGLTVAQLGFGAMELRGPKVWKGREVSDAQAEKILHAVLDAGINFIDTSVDYGLSEERIGRFISGRRGEYILATKCGCDPKDVGDRWETPHTWTRENLRRNIAGSLQRMKTDHVDILQLHCPKPEDVEKGDLVAEMKKMQEEGLTRFVSISTRLPELPTFVKWGCFDTFQIPYSCCEPEHHDCITLAAEAGAGIIVRGGIARGGPDNTFAGDRMKVWNAAKLEELCGDMSPSELILRYTMSHPHCHTNIVGTMNLDHLAANVAAAGKGPLPQALYDEVTRRVKEVTKD